jgi:hypothetical protein
MKVLLIFPSWVTSLELRILAEESDDDLGGEVGDKKFIENQKSNHSQIHQMQNPGSFTVSQL